MKKLGETLIYITPAPIKCHENYTFIAQENYHTDLISHIASSRAFEFSGSDLAGLKSTHAGSYSSGVPYNNMQSWQLFLLYEGI